MISARAEVANADADLKRYELLLERKSGAQKQRDDAATRVDVAKARLDVAQRRVEAAQASLERLLAGARPEEVGVAQARVAAADAAIATLDKQLRDTTLTAPVAGIVTDKLSEAGEVVPPRAPVVVITDLDNAWADVYVPEPAVPRITMGQAAMLYTDAGGDGIPGTVSYISPDGRVHAAQRADGRGARPARVSHPDRGRQPRRRAQAGHAGGRRAGARAAGRHGARRAGVSRSLTARRLQP